VRALNAQRRLQPKHGESIEGAVPRSPSEVSTDVASDGASPRLDRRAESVDSDTEAHPAKQESVVQL